MLEIDPTVAAAIVALRPCIESLLIRSCCNPESLETLNENDRELGQIIRTLSSPKYFSEGNIVKDSLLTDEAMQIRYFFLCACRESLEIARVDKFVGNNCVV